MQHKEKINNNIMLEILFFISLPIALVIMITLLVHLAYMDD